MVILPEVVLNKGGGTGDSHSGTRPEWQEDGRLPLLAVQRGGSWLWSLQPPRPCTPVTHGQERSGRGTYVGRKRPCTLNVTSASVGGVTDGRISYKNTSKMDFGSCPVCRLQDIHLKGGRGRSRGNGPQRHAEQTLATGSQVA